MFGVDVLTWPQIDAIVLDFPIFPAVVNGVLKVAILGPKIAKKWGFSPLKFVRGHIRTPL